MPTLPLPPDPRWDEKMAEISAWCVANGYIFHIPLRGSPWFEKKSESER